MKFYLASKWESGPEMREVRSRIEAAGHTVNSRWLDRHAQLGDGAAPTETLATEPGAPRTFAASDIEDIRSADALLAYACGGGRGGRHVEFGVALALGKRLVLVGQPEHVFHTLANESYSDWNEFLAAAIDMK